MTRFAQDAQKELGLLPRPRKKLNVSISLCLVLSLAWGFLGLGSGLGQASSLENFAQLEQKIACPAQAPIDWAKLIRSPDLSFILLFVGEEPPDWLTELNAALSLDGKHVELLGISQAQANGINTDELDFRRETPRVFITHQGAAWPVLNALMMKKTEADVYLLAWDFAFLGLNHDQAGNSNLAAATAKNFAFPAQTLDNDLTNLFRQPEFHRLAILPRAFAGVALPCSVQMKTDPDPTTVLLPLLLSDPQEPAKLAPLS